MPRKNSKRGEEELVGAGPKSNPKEGLLGRRKPSLKDLLSVSVKRSSSRTSSKKHMVPERSHDPSVDGQGSPVLGKPLTLAVPTTRPTKKRERRKSKWENQDAMTLVEALEKGPPPVRVQIEEVLELLGEMLADEEKGVLTKAKVSSRLHESIFILENLNVPQNGAEEKQATALAEAALEAGDDSVVNDEEVRQWMSSNFMVPKKETLAAVDSKATRLAKLFLGLSSEDPVSIQAAMTKAKCKRVMMFEPLGENATVKQKRALENELGVLERVYHSLGGFCTRCCLKSVAQWDFDVFRFNDSTNERPLTALMMYLFHNLGLFKAFQIDRTVFAKFMGAIEQGYNPLPYHNKIHATDVVQNTYFFLTQDKFQSKLSKRDWLSALLAAAIHDFKHPGKNNNYLKDVEHDLALLYNDRSILENMHIAEAFNLMHQSGYNIFKNTNPEDVSAIRSTVIQMVLGTDMQFHFSMLANLKTRVETETARVEKARSALLESGNEFVVPKPQPQIFDQHEEKDLIMLLEAALHCADLGNPAKRHDIMNKWTQRVTEEFFQQGDAEKAAGLPVSAMMDRTKPNIPKSQVGFIDFIVTPLYRTFGKVFTVGTKEPLQNLQKNKEHWLGIIEASNLDSSKKSSSPRGKRTNTNTSVRKNTDNLKALTLPNSNDNKM